MGLQLTSSVTQKYSRNKIITKKPILKVKFRKRCLGKNNTGKITVRHRSSGHKKKYRKINFEKSIFLGIVYGIEYDPYRTANIVSVFDIKLKRFFYLIASKDLKVGHIIKSGFDAENKIGHITSLRQIPTGCCINNISFKVNGFAKISRSAGNFSVIIKKTKKYAEILLSSGQVKKLPLNLFATVGIVANEFAFLTNIGKAGRARWFGKRPTVRGVAMNPVDHPNGGGEGKKSGNRKTPWGKVMRSAKKKVNK